MTERGYQEEEIWLFAEGERNTKEPKETELELPDFSKAFTLISLILDMLMDTRPLSASHWVTPGLGTSFLDGVAKHICHL